MSSEEPDWSHLCQLTSVPNWDLENGRVITRDLWWTAKLFFGRIVTEESNWLLPLVSPCGDGTIFFSWNYGFRRLNIEITDGLWDCSEYDYSWSHSVGGLLPEEAFKEVQAFYKKALVGKKRQLV